MSERAAPAVTEFHPPCGPIAGWTDGEVLRATGIPYARAERFRAPEPVSDWSDPLQAREWSPPCPQAHVPFLADVANQRLDEREQDEDCQNLSITLPRGEAREPRPVMVWLHGGSYVSGAGDQPPTDPAALAAEQDLIVVTVTYRLGLFGAIGGSPARTANLGLLDQLAALEWVQRNIAAFGGDPANVTVFGQSAGGDAVLHLMATPRAPALMRRVIVQSAPIGTWTRRRARMHAAMLEASDHLDRHSSTAEMIAAVDTAKEVAAGQGLSSAMPFGPQPGRPPLPAREALPAAWERAARTIDVLIGRSADEAHLFVEAIPALTRLDALPIIGRGTGLLLRTLTALVYARPAARLAQRLRDAGGRVAVFRVDWSAPGNPLRAAHGIDLGLLFGSREAWADAALVRGAAWSELQAAARPVRAIWGAFARTGEVPDDGGVEGVIAVRRL